MLFVLTHQVVPDRAVKTAYNEKSERNISYG